MKKSKFIETTFKDTSVVVEKLAAHYNADGFMTMAEVIPCGRKLKLTKAGLFRIVTGQATCVDVDISTTDGGLLVTYAPSLFKENVVAVILSSLVIGPILAIEIIGWTERSGFGEDIFHQISSICASHACITA